MTSHLHGHQNNDTVGHGALGIFVAIMILYYDIGPRFTVVIMSFVVDTPTAPFWGLAYMSCADFMRMLWFPNERLPGWHYS